MGNRGLCHVRSIGNRIDRDRARLAHTRRNVGIAYHYRIAIRGKTAKGRAGLEVRTVDAVLMVSARSHLYGPRWYLAGMGNRGLCHVRSIGNRIDRDRARLAHTRRVVGIAYHYRIAIRGKTAKGQSGLEVRTVDAVLKVSAKGEVTLAVPVGTSQVGWVTVVCATSGALGTGSIVIVPVSLIHVGVVVPGVRTTTGIAIRGKTAKGRAGLEVRTVDAVLKVSAKGEVTLLWSPLVPRR